MAQHHDVELSIGVERTVVDVWDGYTITLSMLQPGSPWTFSFWRSEVSQTNWQRILAGVQLFDPVYLAIDGLVQLGGRVEVRRIDVARETGAVMVLAGRDLAGPAMSWDADPTQCLKGLSLQDALARLLIGVDVTCEVVAADAQAVQVGSVRQPQRRTYSATNATARAARSRVVDLAKPKPGEKIWQVCDRLVRKAGYLLWTAPGTTARSMSLVVDRPVSTGAAQYRFTRIEDDVGKVTGNILRSSLDAQVRDVPTAVTVFASAPRGDATEARLARVVQNFALLDPAIVQDTISDTLWPQPRFVVSQRARTVAESHAEARRVIAEAMAGFRRYTCTVQGHGQDGALYQLNTLAHVRDDISDVDEDWLIVGVEFRGSRSDGQTTTLTMAPRGAIVVESEP